MPFHMKEEKKKLFKDVGSIALEWSHAAHHHQADGFQAERIPRRICTVRVGR